MKTNILILTLLTCMVFASCKNDNSDDLGNITITISGGESVLMYAKSITDFDGYTGSLNGTMHVELEKINGSVPEAKYSSSNNYIATVDEAGMITANHVGEAKIVASNGYHSDTLTVIVDAYELGLRPMPKGDFSWDRMEVSEVIGSDYTNSEYNGKNAMIYSSKITVDLQNTLTGTMTTELCNLVYVFDTSSNNLLYYGIQTNEIKGYYSIPQAAFLQYLTVNIALTETDNDKEGTTYKHGAYINADAFADATMKVHYVEKNTEVVIDNVVGTKDNYTSVSVWFAQPTYEGDFLN